MSEARIKRDQYANTSLRKTRKWPKIDKLLLRSLNCHMKEECHAQSILCSPVLNQIMILVSTIMQMMELPDPSIRLSGRKNLASTTSRKPMSKSNSKEQASEAFVISGSIIFSLQGTAVNTIILESSLEFADI